ncbi:MAG: DUF2461 domain-containing protein [Cyanobacteria bacterium P01_E01_bin.6]
MVSFNFTQKSFDLLEELEANNEKAWYDEHREDFEAYLREPFAEVLELASDRLAETATPLVGSAKTMFRQNRDVRFSKDKSPYNTQISGLLTPSGTKAEKSGLIYLQLDSSGGMMACGFYQLKASELAPIRDQIMEQPKAFSVVLKDLEAAGLFLSDEDKLKTMPRGYEAYSDHEYADYLKLKSLIVQTSLPKSAWLKGDVLERLFEYGTGCASLLAFGNDASE